MVELSKTIEDHENEFREFLYSSISKLDKQSLKIRQANGRFNASDVKRFIEKSNELYTAAKL